MKTIAQTLLCVFLSISASGAEEAMDATALATIRNATWKEYSAYYLQSPLCTEGEITLWSCSVANREYALCSSQVVNRKQGFVQYRAAKAGKLVFAYPTTKRPPAGLFTYTSYRNGDAAVDFLSGGYRYSLVDPLRGSSSLLVTAPDGKVTEITCGPNQTLQLNYTMRLMYDAGVWSP